MAQFVYSMHRVGKIVPPKRHILKNISLSFFPGAKIGVLGLNGAGKSTLLRIMAGIDTEIEGEARPNPGIKIGYKLHLAADSATHEIICADLSLSVIAQRRSAERQMRRHCRA